MKYFGVFYYHSDGYTYSAKNFMGIFESESDAETCVIKLLEKKNDITKTFDYVEDEHCNFSIEEVEVGEIYE